VTGDRLNGPATDCDATPLGAVCVLGGLGFIGRHLCTALARAGYRVRVLDRARDGSSADPPADPAIEIVEGDAACPSDFFRAAHGVRVIVDLAYTTVPGTSMANPEQDVLGNVASAVSWLSRLGQTGVERVVSVSSGGTVYGVPRYFPIDEEHPTHPISSYGITKLAIEKYVAMYSALANVGHAIVRPSNVYGPGQRTDRGQGIVGVLLDRMMRGEAFDMWGTGRSVRDYLYVDDVVAALVAVIEYRGPVTVFNVSTGVGHSVLEVVETVERHTGCRSTVRHLAARGFDVPANVLTSARLAAETGWTPHTSLDDGIERTVASVRAWSARES